MEAMRIDYVLVDLLGEKYTEKIESYIEITDKFIHWRARFFADRLIITEDITSGFRNQFKSYDSYIKRELLSAIHLNYSNDSKTWDVAIEANGVYDFIHIHFKKEESAFPLLKILRNYMLGETIEELEKLYNE